jgi:hypothetical protein
MLLAFLADQGDDVACLDVRVADVDHELVHADGAGDTPAYAAHDDVAAAGQPPVVAVRIAREHGDHLAVGRSSYRRP